MKKCISIIGIIALVGSIYLYTQIFSLTEDKIVTSINLEDACFVESCHWKGYLERQIASGKEKSYSDMWIKKYVTGIEVAYDESVTQNDIVRIGQLQNLKRLSISLLEEDEIDLTPLGNLKELESLEITILSGSMDLSFIENISQLTELYVEVHDETIDLSPIGSLINLKKFSMDACGMALDVSFLKSLNQLTNIKIHKLCELKDLSVFQNMVSLQELSVSYVEDADLGDLTKLSDLKRLYIIGGNIRNAEGLTDLVCLEHLYLYDNSQYTEKTMFDLHLLDKLIELKSISLIYINVNDISPLAGLKYLSYIFLADSDIEDIEPLKDLEKLEELYIFGNKSEIVKKQAEKYFSNLSRVMVTEEIPAGLL